jgi:ATP-dependent DNA helicase RecG
LRNKKLADIFYRLKLIEAYGTGIAKIRGCYADFVKKPNIIITDNAFKVILPNTQYQNTDLTTEEKEIENFAKTKNTFSRQMIEENLNISKTKAVTLLNVLCEKGIISKIGQGRSVVYTMGKV